MRRLLLTILCCILLITTVSAAGSVTDLRSSTLVSENGSCEVTLTFQFQLDAVPAVLDFPCLPPPGTSPSTAAARRPPSPRKPVWWI